MYSTKLSICLSYFGFKSKLTGSWNKHFGPTKPTIIHKKKTPSDFKMIVENKTNCLTNTLVQIIIGPIHPMKK